MKTAASTAIPRETNAQIVPPTPHGISAAQISSQPSQSSQSLQSSISAGQVAEAATVVKPAGGSLAVEQQTRLAQSIWSVSSS